MLWVYDLILLIGSLCQFPKWLLQKKYHGSRLERLGFHLPPKVKGTPCIWIHMVSVGETKAVISIYDQLKKQYPSAAFYFSSTTKTGHLEAKKSLPGGAAYFFLPLDFSWTMRKICAQLNPNFLILSEGDFWLNLMTEVKKQGGKVLLLNGKMSERSRNRFVKVPRFAESLFSQIDLFCLQSKEYSARFQSFSIPAHKMHITGNLKLSIPIKKISEEEKKNARKTFHLSSSKPVITIASTHPKEEEILLFQLPNTQILLAPRHPERFPAIKKFLEKKSYTDVHLVEQMGLLSICYQLSDLAIVGGSFVPGIGGHNIFEPIQAEIPVIFGPYMEAQQELVELILKAKAGIQTPYEELSSAIQKAHTLKPNATQLATYGKEPLEASWKAIEPYFLY